MVISIHQPNFCPWATYFEKIRQSDLFVILGHCQFEKNNYQNRFYADDRWHTMSVVSGNIPINQKHYINPTKDWKRITDRYPNLHVFDRFITDDLWRTNVFIILQACKLLKISTNITFDYPTDLKGTARLVDICKHYGATQYLSGTGGKKYLDLKLFEEANIEVIFQDETKTDKRPLVQLL